MRSQTGGGSVGQSLRYVDIAAPERSAQAGSDLLKQDGLVLRPAIGGGTRKQKKGGFVPSAMSGVVAGSSMLVPMAFVAAQRLLRSKSRKGGGPRGNIWKAEKELAKKELSRIGKPSARNVQAYASAKRKGEAEARAFLAAFTQKKKKVANAIEAREQRKLLKETKKAEREAKKAVQGTRKRKAAAVAVAVEERAPTQLQLLRMAQANAAAAAKAAKPKTVREGQAAWFTLINNAARRLAANGKPSRKNAMRYASLLKKGMNTQKFLANFKSRTRKTPKEEKPKEAVAKPKEAVAKPKEAVAKPKEAVAKPKTLRVKPASVAVAVANAAAAKPKNKTQKEHSSASMRYFEELRQARKILGEVGAPTGPNMSKFASMRIKGLSTNAWLENFKMRRPKTLATAESKPKTARKPATAATSSAAAAKAKPAAKKPLSAVAEEVEENELNSMQGYTPNFEP